MSSFSERNLLVIGATGFAVIVAIVLGALNYTKLPIFKQDAEYSAYFAEASGLMAGSDVQVSGLSLIHI